MSWKAFLLSSFIGAAAAGSQIVPGAFIIEYENVAEIPSSLDIPGAVKTSDLVFDLFKGATYQFQESKGLDEHVAQLLAQPIVKNVWPKELIPAPNDKINWIASPEQVSNHLVRRSDSNDTYSTHVQTQVDKLRAEGVTGEGVKVAIVDTGIDYTHPALGGCFGPNCLVVEGYDFVGDKYNGTNTLVPDDDPMDCQGHGTHVAGIIAAQKNELGFTGAAPGVKLAAYRTYGCTGSSGSDVIMAGFLRAQQDGAHIISASLGYTSGWSEAMLNVVVSRIVAEGVIVVAAAGNAGDDGLFKASVPAGGKGVAAISSYDNTVLPALSSQAYYAVSGGPQQSFYYTPGYPSNWTSVKLPLWTPSFNINQTDQGCNPFPYDTPDLSDKIVLIRRGTCFYDDKATNAAARGAKYIMFYDNGSPGFKFISLSVVNITSVALVSATLGETWVRDLAAGKVVTLGLGDPSTSPIKLESEPNELIGGFMSYFSSWGPSFEADFSATFGTPGGQILSTYPVAKGSYAVLSGTSMATPLASAIYALVATVRKTFNPAELRNVLAATAKPVLANPDGDVRPWLAPTAQQGAGIVQAYAAAYATTVLSEPNLAFNQTSLLTDKSFTVSNTGHEAITYELDVIGAATAYTFSNGSRPDSFPVGPQLDGSFATVQLSDYKVTVPAGGKCDIVVTVTPPSIDAARLPVYGGYIRLNGTNGERLSLPYQGIVGDLNAHTVLNTTYISQTYNQPDFAPVVGGDATFLLPRINITNITDADNLPIVLIDMFFGSPLLKIELLTMGNGTTNSRTNATTNLGSVIFSPTRYAARGPLPWSWNGQLADESWAPAGTYKFRVSALHILGDENDEKQYDVSESPSFTIKYKESEKSPESTQGLGLDLNLNLR